MEVPSHTYLISYVTEQNYILSESILNFISERRHETMLRIIVYQQRMTKCYNSRMQERMSDKRDLVLRKVVTSMKNSADVALRSNWEGPLVVIENQMRI